MIDVLVAARQMLERLAHVGAESPVVAIYCAVLSIFLRNVLSADAAL